MRAAGGGARSVYVHAPFCARRCFYCDFAVQVRRTGDLPAWIEALRREVATLRRTGRFRIDDALDTLYVGGGTPSLLGPEAMSALADVLADHPLEASGEWTAEANPESFTVGVAGAWRAAGVNRVSFGVQSFQESVLRWMGRLHGAEGGRAAVANARAAGFERVSIDLIFGLPAHLERDWSRDLAEALRLDVDHVSLYGLTAEDGTPLGRAVAEGRERLADETRYREEYLEAAETLTRAGFEHYEVSNFARPGSASRHNRAYWTGAPYVGLGNGAHSYDPPFRRWNLRDWRDYQDAARAGRSTVAGEEELDHDAQRLESIWLGLRTSDGVEAPRHVEVRQLVESWRARGWADLDGDVVRLTAEGWLVMDRLAVELEGALRGVGASLQEAPEVSAVRRRLIH